MPGTSGKHAVEDKGQRLAQACQKAESLDAESNCCPCPPLVTVLHGSGMGLLVPIPAPASAISCE